MTKRKGRRQDASIDFENMSRKTGGRSKSVRGKSRSLLSPKSRSLLSPKSRSYGGKGRGARQSGGNVP